MQSLKGLDMYRRVSSDHSQQTYKGGLLTLIVGILMTLLFIHELHDFNTHEILKENYISQETSSSLVQINLDISVYHFPCVSLSLDQQDDVGKHILDSSEHLKKIRLNKFGKEISTEYKVSLKELSLALENDEGCRIQGHIFVTRLPGNFHISYHAIGNMIRQLPEELKRKFKIGHFIHNLSIGNEDLTHLIESEFETNEILSIYNQTSKELPTTTRYDYYIKIIPLEFINEPLDQITNTYQFYMISNTINSPGWVPSIFFRYDFESITTKYTKVNKKLGPFIVSLCAILGGFFTLSTLANKLINN
ncbi:hypothetical protein SteCoe_22915 [Stentor coeruleus]|uniref:Endoplasmic reticulum vesicle transporter C-terminal domain-containing protein n=1 Tax=Stentor coeruleus TaxID=5963 RepID=A0A1R2BL03_9CILI|nr:hypothetical protein SteCoe_22915 [Stentor coeruleus]